MLDPTLDDNAIEIVLRVQYGAPPTRRRYLLPHQKETDIETSLASRLDSDRGAVEAVGGLHDAVQLLLDQEDQGVAAEPAQVEVVREALSVAGERAFLLILGRNHATRREAREEPGVMKAVHEEMSKITERLKELNNGAESDKQYRLKDNKGKWRTVRVWFVPEMEELDVDLKKPSFSEEVPF